MKTRILTLASAAAILSAGVLWHGGLQADALGTPKVAIVDVTGVLENSKKHQAWKDKMEKQQQQMKEEMNTLRSELESLEQQLRLLRRGSEDYTKYSRQYVEKKAIFEARNAFYEDKVTNEMQSWTEELYRTLLLAIDRIAQEKGIDLVLAKEQLDLPAPSLRDFMLTIKTKKVLYNNPKLDITAEVLAALDKEK
ncbi:MAG: OmpH family outer membrane protein [Planctomycetes bacterium]|jgi:Skp family chaperone for outer membrane proteins|nr:OmpH family outer membrane protein [Planctomycetota bacterium]